MKKVLFVLSTIAFSFCIGAEAEPDLYNKDIASFFINAEALYWTAYGDCLKYAWIGTSDNLNGHYKKAHFKWDLGTRISFGYFNASKHWELQMQYVWHYISGAKTIYRPTSTYGDIYICWPHSGYVCTQAHNNVALHYQTLDLLADRVFIPNPHFRLRFVGGLTTAKMKESFNTWAYTSQDDTRVETMWKYLGIGLKLGTSLDWFLGKNFYLTGSCALGALIGHHKSDIDYSITGYLNLSENTKYKDWRPACSAQFLAGPSWQKSFGKCRVEVFAGYEITEWFNVLEILGMADVNSGWSDLSPRTRTERSALGLHGLTCRLSFNF